MAANEEDTVSTDAQTIPASSDTTFMTPSRTSSRRSAHRRDSSPGPSPGMSSSPDFPLQSFSPDGRPNVVEITNDGPLVALDPRRFTPTLHASLVSEILALRRELESKTKVIDALEASLDDSRTENEALNESLSKNSRETSSLKRQLQLLEGGSSSAVTELAKERDEALENISDVRKRLEQAQKKARSRGDEVERTQMLWDRDKEAWEGERRNLERKVHVVEGRLKVVLNEIATVRATRPSSRDRREELAQSVEDSPAQHSDATSVRSHSAFGRRRASTTSLSTHDSERHNVRLSVSSIPNGLGPRTDGLNLAEELAFSERGEDQMDETDDDDVLDSPEALPEERPTSVQSHLSHIVGMKARKILGLSLDSSAQRYNDNDSREPMPLSEQVRALKEGRKPDHARSADYRDAGIQYSPPPSPEFPRPVHSQLAVSPEDHTPFGQEKHAANEGRKRATATSAADSYQTRDSSMVTTKIETVSTSCQTVGNLPTPPRSPSVSESAVQTTPDVKRGAAISTSTQTELSAQAKDAKVSALSPEEQLSPHMAVPMIAIHPPESEPTSTRNSVVLPPHTKSVACQTNFRNFVEGRSVGMQTEEIRVDKRPIKLPASLLPSAIPDQPSTDSNETVIQPYRPPPPRSAKRPLRSPPVVESSTKASKGKQPQKVNAYPGNNDNGPLSEKRRSDIRRPLRSSSLFAGFSDDEAAENEPDIFSDDELFNRPMASYTLRRGKLAKKGRPSFEDSPLPELDEPDFNSDTETNEKTTSNGAHGRSTGSGRERRPQRGQWPSKISTGSRAQDIRRTALISSGTAAHQMSWPQSPSAPSIDSGSGSSTAPRPPFPVPIRLSSRKVPVTASEGAQSPTPRNRSKRAERPPSRTPTLRKVRSASAISISERPERPRSRSPPPVSASTFVSDSPGPSPISLDDIPSRHRRVGKKQSSQYTTSSRTFSYGGEESTAASSVQQTSVVDAIAQTMVGEWMFKYVRRRKSFGVPDPKEGWDAGKNPDETSANITSNGVRHKRWVWLAPYERAVMWSSKQPTNGNALLGKSGRKLTIQSVLDVKDDNPLPKGAQPESHFNRSILILTPQRALKFTAMSPERHFIWLTALSFLSHSAVSANELRSIPPTPQEESASPPPVRRNPIRDTIKVTKSKPRLVVVGGNRSFTAHPPVPEIPLDTMEMRDSTMDAADPPTVPRFSNHCRKRSNTAPRVGPLSLRSFSSNATIPTSTHSATTRTPNSMDLYSGSHSAGVPGSNSFSRRTSVASGFSTNTGNFFEAVGTVRMEAFIDRTNQMSSQRSAYAPRHTMKRDSSQWSSGQQSLEFARSEASSEMSYRHEDLFRGF
ncbi:hypothetical protein DTO169E5_4923 [Paecilomyces variotii]|nr:hypothetical protein DTO169E5_4923 [Paecilomyces variotii]KAJ9393142.1 hypothetical protein DTO063F5_279 [Paecilomyces variotii]